MILMFMLFAVQDTTNLNLSKVLNFAVKLEQEGDYFRAITEYKRFWFYSSPRPDSIIYRIARIYLKENKPDNAVDILKYINKKDSLYKKIYGFAYLKAGDYEKARETYHNNEFIGLTYLYERRFDKAKEYLGDIGKPNRKSPLLGTVLSIFPGGGKFYAGRKFDGFISLMAVASSAIPAYFAYKRNDTIKEYIYGGITLFFYLGNIYGGWLAVQVYNDKSEERFIKGVALRLNFDL